MQEIKSSLIDSSVNAKVAKYAIFDIETTGLSYKNDKILEICVYPFNNSKNIFRTYINPGNDVIIPADVTAINKINASMIENAPNDKLVLNMVYSKFSEYVFVGHNAHDFDAKFLLNYGGVLFDNISFLDTLALAKSVLPGLSTLGGSYSMTNLTKLLGIEIKNQHSAEGDSVALHKIFTKLILLLDDPNDINKFIKIGSSIRKKMS